MVCLSCTYSVVFCSNESISKKTRGKTIPVLSTCYVSDNPWLASSHTTSKDQGQVGANEVGSILLLHHVVTTPDSRSSGVKKQQQTIYNLAWRDAHEHTTQESHLAHTMRTPRRVQLAPSSANRLVQHQSHQCS